MDNKRKRKLALTRLRVRKFRSMQILKKRLVDESENNTHVENSSDDDEASDRSMDEGEGRLMDKDEVEERNAENSESESESESDGEDQDDDEDEDQNVDEGEDQDVDEGGDQDVHEGEDQSDDEGEDQDDDEANLPPQICIANQCDAETRQLKQWAIRYRIAHAHLDPLLHILRTRLLPNLPACSKTFLNTAGATYEVIKMRDGNGSIGEFAYIGVEKGLMACVNIDAHNTTRLIELQFNCDGLSLSKSSSHHIWPILCKVHSDLANYEPFVVALYCGQSKPEKIENYMKELIAEINKLLLNGVTIAGVNYTIKIKCFICDTPARAFLKCTKGHTSANACERCEARGVRVQRTMTYVSVNDNLRTDETFRNFDDPDHHHKASPILLINPTINMISSFVLDFMHLGFLGGNAKLMDYWCLSKSTKRVSQTIKHEISRRLKQTRSQIPHEFQRQLRTLFDLSKWKATEHKLFLLYVGPIVLMKILSTEMYNNFILFHLASRLLWSKETAVTHHEHAKEYLIKFFEDAQKIYGNESATVNTHHLIHLTDDVKNMKCSLSEINAFPYENLLGKIKRFLRSPNRTVAQLCRRLHEQSVIQEPVELKNDIKILKEKNQIISKVQYKGCLLSKASPDDTVLLKNKKVFQMKAFIRQRNSIMLKGLFLKVKDSIYSDPIESTHFNICELHPEPAPSLTIISIEKVKTKIMKLSLNLSENEMPRVFAIPLLHE